MCVCALVSKQGGVGEEKEEEEQEEEEKKKKSGRIQAKMCIVIFRWHNGTITGYFKCSFLCFDVFL